MQTYLKIVLPIISAVYCGLVAASQNDIDAEISEYTRVFNGDNFQQQRRVMDRLIWAGYSATEFYDVMAERLSNLKDSKDKSAKEKAAWYAKSLALSGDEKYRPILTDVAQNARTKKVRKNAELGLQRFPKYQRWNPVIRAGLVDAPDGRLEEARVKNMLAATDYQLLTIGAKRVYHGHENDPELVAIAKERLSQEWARASTDDQEDAVAWLIKVMAESGDRDHKPLLNQIAKESTSSKVRKYAKKYADYLN